MSLASSRVLMRLLAGAFLLLLGNATDGRARPSVRDHRGPAIEAAGQSALLAATTPVGKDVDAALQPLLASDATLPCAQVQSAPAPIRVVSSLCSCERTTVHAARPPPFPV